MTKADFYKLIKKIPKTEIHLHSEALISKETASEILSRKDPKYKDKKVIDELFSYSNLKGFIKIFLMLQSVFEKLSDFEKLFSNILPYLERNGIVYSEIYFSPSSVIRNGIKFQDIISILNNEIDRIKKKTEIEIKVIIDVSRTFGVKNAQRNLEAAIKCKSDSIIGIGLGGDERKGPARDFHEVFKKAEKYGFHRVAHAGEDAGPQSVWDAINYLNVERIGHGIASVKDDKLIDYLAKNKIPLEICPTSNIFTKRFATKIENHPVKPLYDKGVIITLNTDDPGFFNVELLDEYWNLYSKLNFSLDDIKKIIINGFEASFIPESKKKKFIEKVNKAWSSLLVNKK